MLFSFLPLLTLSEALLLAESNLLVPQLMSLIDFSKTSACGSLLIFFYHSFLWSFKYNDLVPSLCTTVTSLSSWSDITNKSENSSTSLRFQYWSGLNSLSSSICSSNPLHVLPDFPSKVFFDALNVPMNGTNSQPIVKYV